MNIPSLAGSLVHLFYPQLCEGCRKPLVAGEQLICTACHMHIPLTDYHHQPDNETAIRFAGRIPFQQATSYAWFTDDSLLQHLLHRLKYQDQKGIGYYLGTLLGMQLAENDWTKDIDGIIPVPLAKKKEAARGYNQSWLIAKGISSQLNIPVLDGLLLRKRDTETQTQKTRAQRVENMRDAFELKDTNTLSGKHILLVDDVLTTGATLEACALALLQAPGLQISIATIAIAS